MPESYDHALEIRRSYYEALYGKAEAHLARNQLVEARRNVYGVDPRRGALSGPEKVNVKVRRVPQTRLLV